MFFSFGGKDLVTVRVALSPHFLSICTCFGMLAERDMSAWCNDAWVSLSRADGTLTKWRVTILSPFGHLCRDRVKVILGGCCVQRITFTLVS